MAALLSGLLLALGYEPVALWPLALVGLAGFFWLTGRLRPRDAARLGYLFGLGLFGPTIAWVYPLGIWVAVLLVAVMACWGMLLAWGVTLVRTLPGWPVWGAAVWVMVEFAWGRFPVGGFGWVRLAYLTPDQPLSGYLGFIGTPGTSFVVALVAALAAWGLDAGPARRRALAAVVGLFAVGAVLLQVPVAAPSGTVQVGMVQGNTNGSAGTEALGYARSVTNNHLSETITLMARVRSGLDRAPQFVLWPENSTDIDPTTDAQTRALVRQAAAITGLPILVGAVMDGPGPDERQTSALWWADDQIRARYDKRNLVPFGEYIPARDVLLPMVPILAEVGAQTVPGTGPGVLSVRLGDGTPLTIGDIICFELAWDQTVRDTVLGGAQLVAVQSNNSTYTHTAQPQQQFVITRVRAMELRRDIVVATTSSFSGLIRADGVIVDRTQEASAAARSYAVPLRSTVSAGVRVGPVLELVLAVSALLGIGFAQRLALRRRSAAQ